MDDIAVIGIGLRFPGNASSPEELWKVLERGESQWEEFPKDRLNIDGYFHPSGDRQGSISFKGAHFLKGDFAAFDAPFFSVSAEDAKAIDPQQRILLETSYEALENAGLRKEDVEGSDTAVYVGSFVKDYEQICLRDPDWQPQYAATGNGIAIMANRISYNFNFHGPSMTLDTGCSGSLVSVHLAAQSLRNGECSLALAAGAGMILTPNTIMPMTALNFLSPDGKCFTFDSRANGYGRGEGIGVVVLKRLKDAIRDNDTIRAVIRGTKVNQDGRTTGITLPSKEAQVANIKSVYESYNLDFNQTAYVECHGTGTQAGDWRELKAISETLGSCRTVENPIYVGSVKPNIGHLEGAAGVAGLIKGVLVLEHGKIPPNINFENGNPTIDFEDWKVKVPTSFMDWPLEGLRRVSVNCFGFGGTNAHVIMDEAPAYLSERHLPGNHTSLDSSKTSEKTTLASETPVPQLFCFSANEKSGVRRVVESHLPYVESHLKGASSEALANYAYTLGCRRSELEWKSTIVASTPEQLISKMQSINDSSMLRSSTDKAPPIGFVFSGQGAQWAGMGKDLMVFEVFRKSLEDANEYMKKSLNCTWDLLEEMFKPEEESRINDPAISQPATTALQVAMVDLLNSLGIMPRHVVGHSSGEIAAAYSAGALSRDSSWAVAYYRGICAALIPARNPHMKMGMIAVGISQSEAQRYAHLAEIACINSADSVTLSGSAAAIEMIAKDLKAKRFFHRILPVTTAYHSKHMKLVEDEYKNYLKGRITRGTQNQGVKMYSSVTGLVAEDLTLDASYWAKNMTSPVQYLSAVRAMMHLSSSKRPGIIIEMSPRNTLQSPTQGILDGANLKSSTLYASILTRKLDGVTSLLEAMAGAWTRGHTVDSQKLITREVYDVSLKCLTDLPPYPWNHTKSYWHESHLGRANRFREFPRQDLIGAPTADSISFEPRWRGFLRVSENPWIQDHQVQKTIVYPAAGMISMVLEGAKQMAKAMVGLQGYEILDFNIIKAMIIPSTAHGLEMALNIKAPGDDALGRYSFSIYSKQLDAPWQLHADGKLCFQFDDVLSKVVLSNFNDTYKGLNATCNESLNCRQLYEHLDIVGMNYGPLFQNIVKIQRGGDSCVSEVRIPDTASKMPAKFEYPHLIHPATLDSMIQTLFAIEPIPMVPTSIKRLFVSANLGKSNSASFHGHSQAMRLGITGANATIMMKEAETSDSMVIIEGLFVQALAAPLPEDGGFIPNHRNLCTEITWKPDVAFASATNFLTHVGLLAHKYPALSVLQVGGAKDTALQILGVLAPDHTSAPRLARYSVLELEGLETASQLIAETKGTHLQPYIENVGSGAKEALLDDVVADYHLVVYFTDSPVEKSALQKLLKAGGSLISFQKPMEDGTPQQETISSKASLYRSKAQQAPDASHPTGLVILSENKSDQWAVNVRDAVAYALSLIHDGFHGLSVEHMSLSDVEASGVALKDKAVISLLEWNTAAGVALKWAEPNFKAFHHLQRTAKGIVWLYPSSGPRGLVCSPMVALARTLISEDPLKIFITLGFETYGVTGDKDVGNIADLVLKVFDKTFMENDNAGPPETEFVEKGGKLYIPRLAPIEPLNRLIESNGESYSNVDVPFEDLKQGLKLTVAKRELDEGALVFASFNQCAAGPNEVEIAFEEAALTLRDLGAAMGRTHEEAVGMDIRGRIRRVGDNIHHLAAGTEVRAFVPNGSLRNSIVVDARYVTTHLQYPPSTLMCAYYALFHIGRAQRRSKVLIHAGASCQGLVAVHMALYQGMEVFATVMGPDAEKQEELLLRCGLSQYHILNAGSPSFVSSMRLRTGRNLDLVFNPTQSHHDVNIDCVRATGTIVQFRGPSDIDHAVKAPKYGIFINFDLPSLVTDQPELVVELFNQSIKMSQMMGEGTFAVERHHANKIFDISDVTNAFKHIKSSSHYGNVLVRTAGSKVPVPATNIAKTLPGSIDPKGAYLLIGGLGGLGRSIANLLVDNGARHLIFLSRSGASSEEAKTFVDGLTQKQVGVEVHKVDICDKDAVHAVISGRSQHSASVVGVFQCAAVIKDAVFDNMAHSDWETAVAPKTLGTVFVMTSLNEHGHQPFLICLASSAGVIGNRGQANYAAGNAFLDAMAIQMRRHGHHAVSIDLGPVLGAGMLADDEKTLDMLRASGFYGIRHEDFLRVVEHAITGEILPGKPMPAQVVLGVGTGGLIAQNKPADPYWTRTALYSYLNLVDMPPPDLSDTTKSSNMDMKTMLASSTDIDNSALIISTGLKHMLAKAMNMLYEEMDENKPPNAYGVDSLVAVGVRNWVITNCGVQVSVFEVLSDKTIMELAVLIAEKGGFGESKGE